MPSHLNLLFVTTLATAPGQKSLDIIDLMLHASTVVRLVLLVLIAMSVVGWLIIGYKLVYLTRAASETSSFLESFWKTKRLDELYQQSELLQRSPVAQLYRAGFIELSKLQQNQEQTGTPPQADDLENIERALGRARTSETTNLESMVPFLATTGSAAPFIGLFGTVIGIMNSFRNIGAQGSANLTTVAPGIAEALIATAIGLVAAIPAVMAYNYFNRKIRVLAADMEAFTADFLNIVKRHFFKH